MKKLLKSVAGLITVMVINICVLIGYYSVNLPDSYYVSKGDSLKLSTRFTIDAVSENALASFAGNTDRKSTRLNSSHIQKSRMPSSA